MSKKSITTKPATAQAKKNTPSPESSLTLVYHRSPQTLHARGGDLEKALSKRGFRVNLRELQSIPRTCPKGQEIQIHYLALGKDDELSLEQAVAAARDQGFEPACSCEFSEAILADGFNPDTPVNNIPSKGALFFTVARRMGENGGGAAMLAAAGEIYTIRASSLGIMKSSPKMVLLCVPKTQTEKRKKPAV